MEGVSTQVQPEDRDEWIDKFTMKDQLYILLPRNSSMQYFADNTTIHFVTKLPWEVQLVGEWEVALTEIQIP